MEAGTIKITKPAFYEEIDEQLQNLVANFYTYPIEKNISRKPELYLIFNFSNKVFKYINFSHSQYMKGSNVGLPRF